LGDQKPRYILQGQLDYIGVTCQLIVLQFAVYPFMIAGMTAAVHIDPWYFVLRSLVSADLVDSFCFAGPRIFFNFLCAALVCRNFALILVTTCLLFRVWEESVTTIQNKSFVGVFIRLTNMSKLVYHRISNYLESLVTTLFFTGFTCAVTFNIATIRAPGIIPMPFYLYFPSVSLLIIVAIHIFYSSAIRIHEVSINSIRKWKLKVFRGILKENIKYNVRRLEALPPFQFCVGFDGWMYFRLFKIVKPTRLTFYRAIADYTFTGLISIPSF